ncbi:MAG: hypothetical protein JST66_07120 [Bacteroidetes bacterium]|nr:hypothetical protein [Bacteroidota bacterium]
MTGQLDVSPLGELVVARLRGEPTTALLRSCQERVLGLAHGTRRDKVLYDATAMTAPPVQVALAQRELDEGLPATGLKRAIVVPDSRLAYLARLAFGDGDYRVFYNDPIAAMQWLHGPAGRD